MTTTAHAAAEELRKLADCFDKQPEVVIESPTIWLHNSTKETFMAAAKIMPRPIKKSVSRPESDYPDLHWEYASQSLRIINSVPQKACCVLVQPAQPAKYDCPSILSEEEEASLETV